MGRITLLVRPFLHVLLRLPRPAQPFLHLHDLNFIEITLREIGPHAAPSALMCNLFDKFQVSHSEIPRTDNDRWLAPGRFVERKIGFLSSLGIESQIVK